VIPVRYSEAMGQKIWTAEELERLSPSEQDELFNASVVTDLDDVPAEFLAKVRQRFHERIRRVDTPPRPQ
jgi:hypothetical protein